MDIYRVTLKVNGQPRLMSDQISLAECKIWLRRMIDDMGLDYQLKVPDKTGYGLVTVFEVTIEKYTYVIPTLTNREG